MDKFGYYVDSNKSFDRLAGEIEKAATARGFRILAVHDVQATLADKGFKIEPLKIFEVCNAVFAHDAVSRDIRAAMFMPCKIVLSERGGSSSITLVRPSMIADLLPDSGLEALASEVEQTLKEIVDEIK